MSDELEKLVREQPLRQPSAELDARIADALRPAISRRWIGWSMAAALALVSASVWLGLSLRSPGSSTDGRGFAEPVPATLSEAGLVRIDQVWSQVTQGELLLTEDDEPVRPVWVQRFYRTSWIDEKQNVRIEMTVPEDQVVLVAAPIQ